MTPQERQLIDDLFERLSRVESAPRDPNATAAIAQGLRKAPNAVYALVQTVLVQDEALKRAKRRLAQARVDGVDWYWPAADRPDRAAGPAGPGPRRCRSRAARGPSRPG